MSEKTDTPDSRNQTERMDAAIGHGMRRAAQQEAEKKLDREAMALVEAFNNALKRVIDLAENGDEDAKNLIFELRLTLNDIPEAYPNGIG